MRLYKLGVFSLFLLLFPVLVNAQAIEDERYGSYFTDDQSFYFYLSYYSDAEYDFMELTEEQKKACQFVFVFDFNGLSGTGYAVKKGNDYVSVPNESVPALTFTLGKNEAGNTLSVKEKSGTTTQLTQIEIMPLGDYGYYDEEYTYDQEGDVGYYDEETDDSAPAVIGFSRSDAAQLLIFIKGEEISFSVEIPEKKGCQAVSIQGKFVQSGEQEDTFTYTDGDGYHLEAQMIDKDGLLGWQFSCLAGTCFDSKKCNIWKEPFFMNN